MYLDLFLADFVVFRVFGGISRDFEEIPEYRGSATAQNIRSPDYYQRLERGSWSFQLLFHENPTSTFFITFLKSRFFFCNGSKTDTLKRLMYRFIIGLFLKLRKSTFQQKKNYGVLMKPSELFVLKDTVIFLALKFFPSQCLCEK